MSCVVSLSIRQHTLAHQQHQEFDVIFRSPVLCERAPQNSDVQPWHFQSMNIMHCMLPSMHAFAVMLVLAEVLTVTHGLSSYVLSLAEGLAHAGMLLTCVVCGRLENAGLAIEVLPPYLQQGKAPHEP